MEKYNSSKNSENLNQEPCRISKERWVNGRKIEQSYYRNNLEISRQWLEADGGIIGYHYVYDKDGQIINKRDLISNHFWYELFPTSDQPNDQAIQEWSKNGDLIIERHIDDNLTIEWYKDGMLITIVKFP